MLECNRYIHKKLTGVVRFVSLLLPIVCVVLLMSQVTLAKNIFHISDGDQLIVHTTYATDPMDVLNEAGLELGKDDTFTTEEGDGVSQITIQRLQTITIFYHGKTVVATTYGETVESLLERYHITLRDHNKISVALDAKTYDRMHIAIDSELTLEESYLIPGDFETLYYLDPSLSKGEQVILVPGRESQTKVVDAVVYCNGKETGRTNVSTALVSDSVTQLIAVGSLEGIDESLLLDNQSKEVKLEVASHLAGLGKLFICDGLIVTAKGEILTYDSTMQVKATAYTHTDAGCDMITATGTTVRVGTVAVDPKVIPYGTRMFIITNDGTYVYGIAVAEDCGSAIKKNRVDLYFPTDAECWQFGIRQATIYFINE